MVRQVHGSNILVRQYHAIGGEVKLVSMLQVSDIVELRIEHETPVLDHSTCSRRDRAARVDEVNRLVTALTTENGLHRERGQFSRMEL